MWKEKLKTDGIMNIFEEYQIDTSFMHLLAFCFFQTR